MINYYGLAVDGKGKSYVLKELPDTHISALNEAQLRCKEQGLIFQTLRKTESSKDNGSTLTKFARARNKVNGKLGRIK